MTYTKKVIITAKSSVLDFLPWDPEAIYSRGHIVIWKDKTWIAKSGNEHGIEPGTDDSVWVEYDPNSIVKAVVQGPTMAYAGQRVRLIAKDSTSSISDISSYEWELPEEIISHDLGDSTLYFDAPEVTESKGFLIKLTAINELGYKDTAEHTLTVVPFNPHE